MILSDSSGSDEDHEVKVEVKDPKKRAETWVQDEVKQALVGVDFIGDERKGFNQSPTMCTDKWRNLLKEFKKAKHQDKGRKKKKKKERMGGGETERKIWGSRRK